MAEITTQPVDSQPQGHSIGVRGWIQLCALGAVCAGVGNVAARLGGFPYYMDNQGVLAQQPIGILVWTVPAIVVSVMVATRLGVMLTGSARLGVGMGMFSLAGFSLRGGTMAGVIQAIGGRETFWLLAVELAVFGLISAGAFAWAGRMARDDKAVNPSGGAYAGMIQVLAAAVVIWLLGKSYQKGQAVGCVFIAGMVASWVSYILTGSTWRYGCSVPLIVGVFGYMACALWGSTSPVVMGNVDAFAIASPLDYAAFGPIGVILGEILHKEDTTRQK